jgi:DNA uptake protein ComE-like DNA-binding protein
VRIRAGLTALIALVALSLAGGVSAGQGKVPAAPPAQHKPVAQPAPIDINSASPAQLKTLPGIGTAEAERIVAGRPYLSKASLVTDKIIPAGVYQEIRHQIIAIQHTTPTHPATKGSELNSDPS